ncbi:MULTISPECIES: TIGR02301 family protein [unclassified Aminobacter]|jgi:uncharacterized protein (TIGR02301 family)|uniref:TIGR02301 family protein n=1 Tax=unclassified Aminobacter TaxID=2644704 RepID=UPI0004679E07|nr:MULTISPECIES: TIGR02301 family protein [unclassified Aminobacter]TWG67638.1 uncharacterized protein (TIGR02301 family) [Aminobacter sp. J44]TWH34257.1 uncharacterized protein (TIGR02301 family) [Aminobacter sp. J15]
MIRKLGCTATALLLAAAIAAQPVRAADSPFENQLLRLAEILGALHYLRNLCGEESVEWRDRMNTLLEVENPDESRRARFVASFNKGYRSYQQSYATCTTSAVEAINRYMREGEALTRDTATRFGN